MSHPFGDLIKQHLNKKHGLSQSKLARGIGQDPAVITKMCQGKRLSGIQARERVAAIIDWLHQEDALSCLAEANALLEAAGMSQLNADLPPEAKLIERLPAKIKHGRPAAPIQTTAVIEPHTKIRFQPLFRYGLLGLAVAGLLLTAGLSWRYLRASAENGRITTRDNGWCSAAPVAIEQYGWRGSDPVYSMFYDPEAALDRVDYYVYYQAEYVGIEVNQLRGMNPERRQWEFTITPQWAKANPGWDDPIRWRVDYECRLD